MKPLLDDSEIFRHAAPEIVQVELDLKTKEKEQVQCHACMHRSPRIYTCMRPASAARCEREKLTRDQSSYTKFSLEIRISDDVL